MKKNIIILIITIVIALLRLINIDFSKQEDKLTVTMYYTGDNLQYDFESSSYKYNKIELTDEQQKKIIKLYKKTNIEKKQDVQEAFIGMIKLEFSDGSVIFMDDNNSGYAYNGKYCIRLSNGFKKYILEIID